MEYIILAYGYCGNALLGLNSPNAKLVIPKVDDCIPLLLGSYQVRQNLSHEMGTYYLTKGWMEYENNIIKEYERCLGRYGKQRTERILKIMLENYRRLVLIDTGAYCLTECLEKSRTMARELGLEHQVVFGSLGLLKKLFTGPWDDEFLIVEPGEVLTLDHFRIDLSKPLSNLTQFGFSYSSLPRYQRPI